MTILFLYIVWICYSCLEGWREAYYFHYKIRAGETANKGEHIIFTIQRFIVLFLILGSSWDFINAHELIYKFLYVISFQISFPFFHDGMYYFFRNRFDPHIYRKGYFDQSTTSSAISTRYFTPLIRTILFVLGCAFIVTKFLLRLF